MATNKINLPLYFGMQDMPVGPSGVEGYCWPLSRTELLAMRDVLIPRYSSVVRSALQRSETGAVELLTLATYFVAEAMMVYQGQTVLDRLRNSGRELVIPADYRIWTALRDDRLPTPAPVLMALCASFPGRTLREVLFKPIRSLMEIKGRIRKGKAQETKTRPDDSPDGDLLRIHSARPSRSLLHDGVVVIKRGDILSMHARHETRKVALVAFKHWFSPLEPSQVASRAANAVAPTLQREVNEALDAAFGAGGATFSLTARTYLEHFLSFGSAAVQMHLQRLMRWPEQLPATLWCGSGGDLWGRMLRLAVRANGGHASVHSHSGGSEYEVFPYDYFNELVACDEYVVYTPKQVEFVKSKIVPEMIMESAIPDVIPVHAAKIAAPTRGRNAAPAAEPHKIMFVDCGYDGERVHIHPAFPDMVQIDWQARLFSHLLALGYEVLQKPHPQDAPPPRAFAQMGVHRLNELFESVIDQADVLLFDSHTTSTFNIALMSDKPIVFIDLGKAVWEKDALELLRRRAAVLEAQISTDNRITLDWRALDEAIKRAGDLVGDSAFVERYCI